jgi:hypothetical protein
MDLAELARQALPYLVSAITAYGGSVLSKTEDAVGEAAADAAVGLGRRLLQRILRREESRPAIEAAVADVVAAPQDEDFAMALRAQLKKVLAADPELASDVASLLKGAESTATVTASGKRAIAAHTISGVAATGDNTKIQR